MGVSGRAIKAGDAFVSISAEDRTKTALRNIERRMYTFSRTMQQLGTVALGSGLAIASGFAPAIKMASDFEEQLSKFNVVFGENADSVRQWGDEFAKQVGRSRSEVVAMLAQAQDTFVPLGFSPEEAEAMSKQLVRLSVDLASFNNMSDSEAFERLISSMVGNTENLRAFGVVAQQTQIKAQAMAMGFDPATLTPYQKALAIMELTMQGTTSAQGDAIRTADSFANTMKRLKSSIQDSMVEAGRIMLPMLSKLATLLNYVAKGVGDWAQQNPGLVQGIAAIGAVLVVAGGGMLALSYATTVAKIGIGILTAAYSAFGAISSIAVNAVTISMAALEAVTLALTTPLGIIVAVLAGGVAAWAAFTESGNRAVSSLLGALGQLFQWTKMVFGGIWDAIAAGDWGTAGQIMWLSLRIAWSKGVGSLYGMWLDFKNACILIFDDLGATIQRSWRGTIDSIAEGILWVADQINAASEAVTGAQLFAIDTNAIRETMAGDAERFERELNRRIVARAAARDEAKAAALATYDTSGMSNELDALVETARKKRESIGQVGSAEELAEDMKKAAGLSFDAEAMKAQMGDSAAMMDATRGVESALSMLSTDLIPRLNAMQPTSFSLGSFSANEIQTMGFENKDIKRGADATEALLDAYLNRRDAAIDPGSGIAIV